MRIKELSQRSGLPKTTIHYYQRDGLLPPPQKTARNAAFYGEQHLERLALIQKLRAVPLRMAYLRRAIQLIEQGVQVEVAVALQQGLVDSPDDATMGRLELAQACGLPVEEVEPILQSGLAGEPGRQRFHLRDAQAVRAVEQMRKHGTSLDFLQRTAADLRSVIQAEFALADHLTATMAAAQRSATLLELQHAVDCLHSYWLDQARQQEVFRRWPTDLQNLVQEQLQ